MVTNTPRKGVFGKRTEPHTIIIARGDEIRHFTIRPWIAALAGSVIAAMAIGYLSATTYLVLRDDLIGANDARQARMQQAYEDRISMLRAQVDRITSRQLLDQHLMETKLSELIERQSQLTRRQGHLGPIIDRLAGEEPDMPETMPAPAERPDQRAELRSGGERFEIRVPGAAPLMTAGNAYWPTARANPFALPADAHESDRLFVEITESLEEIETEQFQGIGALATNVWQTVEQVADALESIGLKSATGPESNATGGPLIPISGSSVFDERVRDLDQALENLEAIKRLARTAPIANPAPGHSVSSNFGPRRDPFIGRLAHHSGIDFRAPPGAPILSAGAGTVISAGWNGGYGRMVEIDHGNGLTTRYAHMSQISVQEGDRIEPGAIIGKVGSTGRSTGPHLHFEVRRGGSAVDPRPFLRAGRKVAELL